MGDRRYSFARAVRVLCIAATSACALALPASALGADSFVDKENAGGLLCTLGDPCPTVQAGVNAAGASDTVHVDDSAVAYTEEVMLGDGKSLIADDFVGGDEGPTIIDGGLNSAINVLATPAGTVQGLTLRGDESGVSAIQNVTVTGNTFDDPQESGVGDISLGANVVGAATVISGNTFNGAPAGALDNGIAMSGGPDPMIVNNNFSGYDFAISPAGDGTDPTIQGNTISGGEANHPLAAGVFVNDDSEATVIGNTVQLPAAGTRGIYVLENTASGANTGATLRRNKVLSLPNGVVVEDTTGVVTLDSDLIVNSSAHGLHLLDTAIAGGLTADQGDVSAVNVTLASNVSDIEAEDADLTLDSSIVEDAVDTNGVVACSISFSRGPTLGAPNCGNFQTTANPGFVSGTDFHLAGTAMVDVGNPAPPDPASLDIDGGARQVLNLGSCAPASARRDIGADEANFIITPACAGPTSNPPVSNPTPTPKKKKCKKKKRRSASAAKKCKRKK